ncbi:putative membrane protein [Spinactinospora alkalitolerans]|uniref:Putative membrane protein n=1 Tax=Spinactinospora alkalitolerans TaxID=687207 RepID=A0A852TNY3_9ACTN|nr:glutamine amidotransferase [Spinactinospora alkalitolerans]NYE46066.1 putative membrane protein [Spinactinospora alkalitolerans]
MSRVLIAGESWMTESTHVKGVDSFTVHSYVEGVGPLRDALEAAGHTVTHLPAHLVPARFPGDAEALSAYDLVVLSDIGANSIQLDPAVLERSERGEDRLANLAGWVAEGGALMMIGGYLSFTGFQAKAAFRQTPIAPALPVELLPDDDRVELPAGADPAVLDAGHPALGGAGGQWPHLLGYNRVAARDGAATLATINGDPLVVVGEHGRGRTAVFTSDCSPHWAPPSFCEQWSGYGRLFDGLVRWLAN